MDLITYCPDIPALIAEVEIVRPDLVQTDESGGKWLSPLTRIPVYYNGAESLCVVRDPPEEIQALTTLSILGVIERDETGEPMAIFNSPADQATYERVRGPLTETVIVEGQETTMVRPYLIGAFA